MSPVWALYCSTHVNESARPGGPPFGRCPRALPNPGPVFALVDPVIILAVAERGVQGVSGPVAPSEGAATHAADVGLEGRVGGDECQALDQRGRGDQAVEGVSMVERKSRQGLDVVRFEGEQVDVSRRK